ncbi:MAG TPA: FKBP-type peptidyl-prolyl cis-trans isomerase, partial [Chitinophagales bacterium]|nr:FKBP-type peptidyl-prolyl cis-trans isomerase [Chitinophagales bacterium]
MKQAPLLLILLLFSCQRQPKSVGHNKIQVNDTVFLNFVLMHADGRKFDASDHSDHQDKLRSNEPLRVIAGRNDVIKGFDEALLSGLWIGDSAKVKLPPEKAFGNKGVPDIILPGETILVHLEIVNVKKYYAQPYT